MTALVLELRNGATISSFDRVTVSTSAVGPSPFELFLSSLAACAALTIDAYCAYRGLQIDGLKIHATAERDEKTHMATRITYEYEFPDGFPDNEKHLVIRAANTCFVKKHLYTPPKFESVIRQ